MSKKTLRIALIIIVTLILGILACYLFVRIANDKLQQELGTEEVNNPVVDLSQFIENNSLFLEYLLPLQSQE